MSFDVCVRELIGIPTLYAMSVVVVVVDSILLYWLNNCVMRFLSCHILLYIWVPQSGAGIIFTRMCRVWVVEVAS